MALPTTFSASLAQPGGNVSGVTLYGSELARKRMEVFREAVTTIRQVATPPALALKRKTTTIPIIMAPAADPLRTGLVAQFIHVRYCEEAGTVLFGAPSDC
jgi:hypothetical protein